MSIKQKYKIEIILLPKILCGNEFLQQSINKMFGEIFLCIKVNPGNL